MSKIALGVAGLLLAAVGFGLGYSLAPSLAPPAPPAPRSAEQAATDTELVGRIRGVLLEFNPFARLEALASLLGKLGREDVPEVVEVLERGALGLGGAEIDLLTRFWTSYEPKPAVEWAWRGSPDGARAVAIYAAMETAAKQDPETTLALMNLQQNLSQFNADVGREALVRGWFLSGRAGVEDYLRGLNHGIPQQRCLRVLANVILHRDGPEGLARWLEELEDRGHMFKTSAYRKAAPELVRADLEFALKWCDQRCDGPHGAHLLAIVAKTWALQDGLAAIKWVSTAPAGSERDRAVKAVLLKWRWKDREGHDRFIDEMDPDSVEPWFVPAAAGVARGKARDNPLEAYKWAALVPDDGKRESVYIQVTRIFRAVDEPGAEAWLEQSPLSEEARAKARALPPEPKGRRQGNRPNPLPPKAPQQGN